MSHVVDEYRDLVRISGPMAADHLISFLTHGQVKSQLRDLPCSTRARDSSPPMMVVQVLNTDFDRAMALLDEYRKFQGVPFS